MTVNNPDFVFNTRGPFMLKSCSSSGTNFWHDCTNMRVQTASHLAIDPLGHNLFRISHQEKSGHKFWAQEQTKYVCLPPSHTSKKHIHVAGLCFAATKKLQILMTKVT